jgi:enoyl-CoA hydratase
VLPADKLLEEAKAAAKKIAGMSRPIAMMTKESVNAAYETMLHQGIMFERRLFHSMFSTDDQKEGMAAFVEKRPAKFSNS